MARGEMRVRDVMSQHVLTLNRNDKLSIPDDLMKQKRIRHIPVLDEEGRLCGIVSQRDLFRGALLRTLGYGSRAEERMLEQLVVKDAMTNDPLSIGPDEPLARAARLMLEHKIGCLPVIEGEALVGILTEADFVALAARS